MNFDVTKIVVTGASGFLGRNLVNDLKEKKAFVVNALSSHGNKLQKMNTSANVTFYDKDVIFTTQNRSILEGSILINCAFPRNSTGIGMADGLKYIQGVFLEAKECKAKAVINISSQSVYSALRETAATEETPVCLETTYAVGKYATELMLETVLKGTDISYTNIRLASLIGPGFDQRIVNRFVKSALSKDNLDVNVGKQRYGFLDIKDAVAGIVSIINSGKFVWAKAYNLGPRGGYTIEEIAQVVCNLSKRYCDNGIEYKANKVDVNCNSTIDSSMFYREFNWEPSITIVNSVEEIYRNEVVN